RLAGGSCVSRVTRIIAIPFLSHKNSPSFVPLRRKDARQSASCAERRAHRWAFCMNFSNLVFPALSRLRATSPLEFAFVAAYSPLDRAPFALEFPPYLPPFRRAPLQSTHNTQ